MATYRVTWVADDPDDLQRQLNALVASDRNARVISVSWQPEHPNQNGGTPVPAGYTCVSEHPDA
jgi:hypothetical protein